MKRSVALLRAVLLFVVSLSHVFNPDGLESNSLRCLLPRFQIGNKYGLYLEAKYRNVLSFDIIYFVESEQKYSLEGT